MCPHSTLKVVKEANWTLFGKRVEVVDKYTYLGTVTTAAEGDWRQHVLSVIAQAKKRSNDLMCMLRYDRGIRPRTAVTLWWPRGMSSFGLPVVSGG